MSIENQILVMVDLETEAWDIQDAEELVSLFHPDMVLPWPPDKFSHDPITWVFPYGRFNRVRWNESWEELFRSYVLVHNHRDIKRIVVSDQADGAFAVVDVGTLWRHR